jgi:hypothetical protein
MTFKRWSATASGSSTLRCRSSPWTMPTRCLLHHGPAMSGGRPHQPNAIHLSRATVRARVPARCAAVAAILGAAVLALLPGESPAHEHRAVGNGAFQVEVGWENEPAVEGDKNALTVQIVRADAANSPVENADRTLRAEVRQGTQTRQLTLSPVPQQPGEYRSEFVPTRGGDYIFTLTGAIDNVQIREQFDTADGKIDSIRPLADQQFPVVAGGPADVASAVRSAQADAQTARTIGLVGIGIAVLGLLTALVALIRSNRPPLQ